VQFPSTTLIRLYEFLKNSRESYRFACQLIISINTKEAWLKATLVLNEYREIGGGDRTRTRYLLLAKQPLSQLSYTPKKPVETRIGVDGWWVWLVSNQRPPPYQDGALTN
jgi:hypothetical protein